MSVELGSASQEAAWQALRQHIEWTQGFWSGWVFTDYTPSLHELHRRAEVLLRGVGRQTVFRQPREPAELVDVLLWLNAGADGCDGCVIVAVVQSGEAWRDAWDQLMLRLNERRELLRAKIQGGLLLCAPTSFKARTREAAPDLWSIRSLALEVAPVAGRIAEPGHVRLSEPAPVEGSEAEVTLALQGVNAAGRAGQVDAEVEARIRAARALFAVGRRDEGREQAVAAVEVAASVRASARALATLADLEGELGDLVAAERHYRAAIDANREEVDVWAHAHLVDILIDSHALSEAQAFAELALAASRARRDRLGDTPETVREELVSWSRVARIKSEQGDWKGAGDAYHAGLSLTRILRARIGDTIAILRDERWLWLGLGDVRRASGDLSGAGEAYDASLALSRRVRTMMGDEAEALRDEGACLQRVGSLKMMQNDLDGARAAYEASLTLVRRARDMSGDRADVLQDEAQALGDVGDVLWAQGAVAAATEAYEASLELRQRVRAMTGDTAEALLSEAAGWNRIGRDGVDRGRACEANRRVISLHRQARRIVGDTVHMLGELATSLYNCAQCDRRDGELVSAHAALLEAVQCRREIRARCDDLPSHMDDLEAMLKELRELEGEIAGLRAPE